MPAPKYFLNLNIKYKWNELFHIWLKDFKNCLHLKVHIIKFSFNSSDDWNIKNKVYQWRLQC